MLSTSLVDKLADYEDQIHQLKKSVPPAASQESHSSPADPAPSSETMITHRTLLQSRFASLLPSSRRSASTPPSSAPPTQLTHSQSLHHQSSRAANQETSAPPHHQHTTSNPTVLPSSSSSGAISPAPSKDLHAALAQERSLRLAVEAQLTATSTEIEELSTQLFSEANELVATERRSLAALQQKHAQLEEDKIILEKRVAEREREEGRLKNRLEVLEKRDGEKGRRWEELEKRVGRVERVKRLLAEEGGRRVVSEGAVVEGKGIFKYSVLQIRISEDGPIPLESIEELRLDNVSPLQASHLPETRLDLLLDAREQSM
ncbi:MAG: hypothetical protein Q9220_000712 [cf. Caloplaca sp. 1 TL-2023]